MTPSPTTAQKAAKKAAAKKATPPRSKADLHRRQEVEAWLDAKGVHWTYVDAVSLDEFDKNRSLANQARFHAVDEELVDRYVAAMERGDVFPAVVATMLGKKLINVDGNHRYLAWERLDEHVPTYVIEGDPQTIVTMTYEANTKHGKPTSLEERQQHAIWLLDNNASQATAAAATGLTLPQVKSAWAKASVERRARNLGIREWNRLNVGSRQRLGQILTDEGLEAGVKLAIEAQMKVDEVNEMVTDVNRLRSATKQVEAVEGWRERLRDRIQTTAGGVIRRTQDRTPKGLLYSAIGFLDKVTAVEIADSVHNPAEIEEILRRVKRVTGTLDLLEDLLSAKSREVAAG